MHKAPQRYVRPGAGCLGRAWAGEGAACSLSHAPWRFLSTRLHRPAPPRGDGGAQLSSQAWRPFWATRVACGVLDASTSRLSSPCPGCLWGSVGGRGRGAGTEGPLRPGQQPVPPGGRGQAVTRGRPAACPPGLPRTWGSRGPAGSCSPGAWPPRSPSSADDSGSGGSSLQGP